MKTFNIMTLIDSTNFGFTVDSTQIFTAADFFVTIRAKWHHMVFDCMTVADNADPTDPAVLTAAKAEFTGLFAAWKNQTGGNLKRAILALNEQYSPLENYNRIEEGSETTEKHFGSVETRTVSEAGSETNAHHKGSKTSTGEETITTPGVEVKTTEYRVAFDGSSETETGSATSVPVRGTDKVEKDATKNFVTVSDIDASTYDKDVREFTDRETTDTVTKSDVDADTFDRDVHLYTDRVTRGNIGVTTSQEMLRQELELRLQNYVEGIIDTFVSRYCYFAEGVE